MAAVPVDGMPPVVILRDPEAEHTAELTARAVDLRAVAERIASLDPFEPRAAWVAHTTEIARLSSGAAAILPVPARIPDPRSPVQDYFRTRTFALPDDQAQGQVLGLIARVAADLAEVPLAAADLERLRDGLVLLLEIDAGRPLAPHQIGDPSRLPEAGPELYLYRWIVAHQVHAALVVAATIALGRAIRSLPVSLTDAAEALSTARSLVQAFPPARAYALAVPASFYLDVLRPTMLPPMVTAPLSGRMHTEYRVFRRTMKSLLEALPQPAIELARQYPRLALARDALLEADLIDAERHVTSIETLVGADRSLIQASKSTDNAVSALRRIRAARARELAPYLRFPQREP